MDKEVARLLLQIEEKLQEQRSQIEEKFQEQVTSLRAENEELRSEIKTIKKGEEKQLSALPDPENFKWNDKFYYVGNKFLKIVPFSRAGLEAVAPKEIKDVDGGVDRACSVILFVQIILLGAYAWFGFTGYEDCRRVRYLSLVPEDTCVEVKRSINDVFRLDDSGYWDSSYEWAFADSMVSGAFVAFQTTADEWPKYARDMWNVLDEWNEDWQYKPAVDNMMSMVVSERKVAGKSLLLARVLADPKALMDSSYTDVVAINQHPGQEGSFALSYDDLGNTFLLSAPTSSWNENLPKWKFASPKVASADPLIGIEVNKYSAWVAAAVNLGIISIKDLTDLTDTSFASAYSVPADDDAADITDDGGTPLPEGVTCFLKDFYKDGYCDSKNNLAGCQWDGGDCCESTCGEGYDTTAACGTGGYACLNPEAPDFGAAEKIELDDDASGEEVPDKNNYYAPVSGYYGYSEGGFYDYFAGDDGLDVDIDFDDEGYSEGYYSEEGYYYYLDDDVPSLVDDSLIPGNDVPTSAPSAAPSLVPSSGDSVPTSVPTSVPSSGDAVPTSAPSAAPSLVPSAAGGGRRHLLVEPFKRCKRTEKEYKILLFDSGGDGWEGNVLTFDAFKTEAKSFTLARGSNGTAKVCLKNGQYQPYACGGNYPSEVTWTWVIDEVKATSGAVLSAAKLLMGGAGNKCLNKASGGVSYRVAVNPAESNVPTFTPTPPPTHSPVVVNSTTAAPSPPPSHAPTPTPSSAPSQTFSPSAQPTEDRMWEFGLKQYVLYKYYEEMDPIECAKVNGSDYCWVQGNRGKKGTKEEYLGAMLFPIIQHFNADCYNCSSTATNNPKECNSADLEILLYFNPAMASVPAFVDTFNATFREERNKYTVENSGLNGVLYLNFYGGVKYLNSLFYALPDTHCTKPIALAKGAKVKNAFACGTKYQRGLVKSNKKAIAKKARKSFCTVPPVDPQETYFECRYDEYACVREAIAQAAGQTAIVAAMLAALILTVAVKIMGLPVEVKLGAGDQRTDGNLAQRIYASVCRKKKNKVAAADPTVENHQLKAEKLSGKAGGGVTSFSPDNSTVEMVPVEAIPFSRRSASSSLKNDLVEEDISPFAEDTTHENNEGDSDSSAEM